MTSNYTGTLRPILQYDLGTWALRPDVQKLSVSECRCFRIFAGVSSENRVSHANVSVSRSGLEQSIGQTMNLNGLNLAGTYCTSL